MSKIIEFLIWDNCNNNCKFCFLKDHNPCPSFLTDCEKKESIKQVISFIDSGGVNIGDSILLCGGEIFDTKFGEETKKYWDVLINKIVNLLSKGIIKEVFVNTNLIYNPNILLYDFLDKFKDIEYNSLNFTTSYDLIGRFKNTGDKLLFEKNISLLHQKYRGLKIVINMVMTKQLCNLILDGDISILDLQNKFGAYINLIPYIILVDSLAPSRNLVLETLSYVDKEIPGYLPLYARRFINDPKRVLLKFFNNGLKEVTTDVNGCGHSINFSKYNSDGSCYICDLIRLLGEYNERV